MQARVEALEGLNRQMQFVVPAEQLNQRVHKKLQEIARTARIHGFRPGRAPLKIITQRYGEEAHHETLSLLAREAFTQQIALHAVRLAGQPALELVQETDPASEEMPREASQDFTFKATFEVYPDIHIGDLTTVTIEKPVIDVDDAVVARVIEKIRRQYMEFEPVDRPAVLGDRVVLDYRGTLDDVLFEGGQAEGFALELGQQRMLPAFEAAVLGLSAGETKTFPLLFPEDYPHALLAAKTAQFTVSVKSVEAPILPEMDAVLIKLVGNKDADLAQMSQELQEKVRLGLADRVQQVLKKNVMTALTAVTPCEVPQALMGMQIRRQLAQLQDSMRNNHPNAPMPNIEPERFQENARRSVSLGLITRQLIEEAQLNATPEQIKIQVTRLAAAFEDPAEMVAWYYQDAKRLEHPRQLAEEDNIVDWALARAKVIEKPLTFEELIAESDA